jgi:hypothetical protein
VRDEYGYGTEKHQGDGAPRLMQQFLAARRLVEAGVRCVTLSLQYPVLTSTHPRTPEFRSFYRGLAAEIRRRGLAIVVQMGSAFREPEFGPMVTEDLGGHEVTFPEWCKVTVKRYVAGVIAEFTAVEYWLENYATKGGKERSEAPNAMWMKRKRGQIAKCAEAQALRACFEMLKRRFA